MDAMAVASRALSFGIVENADDMAELTEIAITLGRAQGLSATQATSDLTTALARQSPMILDNLGITLKLTEAYAIYADELGVTTEELTNEQKQQAFVNAAMIKGKEVVASMGGVQEDAAASAERLSAQLSDASVALGEQLLPLVVSGAEKLTDMVAAFNAMDEGAQKAIVTLGGVAAATGPALKAFSGIVSVAPGLGAGIGNVAAGFQLLAGGASAAQVASLGLAGAMAVALPVVVALTAAVVAAKKAHDLAAEAQERQAEVADTWTQFLRDQVAEGGSAVDMAEEYTAAQERVGDALENTSIIQGWFIDEQAAMNASSTQLAAAVLEAADSYEDYRTALEMVGLGSAEVGVALDEMSFTMQKARYSAEEFSVHAGSVIEGVEGIAQAAQPTTDALGSLYETSNSVARSFGEMTFDYDTLWNLALASGASTEALAALAQSLGIASEAEIQHTLEGQRLVEMFGQGLITAAQLQEGFHGLATAASVARVEAASLATETSSVVQGVSGVAKADGEAAANALSLAKAEAEAATAASEHREQVGQMSESLVEASEQAVGLTESDVELTDTTFNLRDATGELENTVGDLQTAEENAAGATVDLGQAAEETSNRFENMRGSVDRSIGRMNMLENAALGTQRALASIEREITIHVNYVTSGAAPGLQAGTMHFPGGLALVGEAGPEFVALPRGSRVYPAGQTRGMLADMGAGTSVATPGRAVNALTVNIYGANEPQASADAVISAMRDRGLIPQTSYR